MVPTFVIGLREGLEAALIVGIVAAFLRKQGRRDLLRWVVIGVCAAVALCVGIGVALDVVSKDLPQRQQEGLETIIGALAVCMVTFMVIWMKRHSRQLKGQLEGLVADAMGARSGAARAMVLMAFLAVLREGVETVIFLLAAFNQSASGASAAFGATLGVLVAIGLGYGIYRGGVRINLSRFFRATGLVLVVVAAGLVVNVAHTAHEAGWLDIGQGRTVDLTWLVDPGSVQASLLTGMLGLQSRPVEIEVFAWLVYLVPVGLYVGWPPGRSPARRTVARLLLVTAGALAAGTAVLALVTPDRPATVAPNEAGSEVGSEVGRVVSVSHGAAVVRREAGTVTVHKTGTELRAGVATEVFAARYAGTTAASLPRRLSYQRIAELNGGRLPIGLTVTGRSSTVRYVDTVTLTAWIEPRTGRIIDLRSRERVAAWAVDPVRGALALAHPVDSSDSRWPGATVRSAASAASDDLTDLDRRSLFTRLTWLAGVSAIGVLAAGVGLAGVPRRWSTLENRSAIRVSI